MRRVAAALAALALVPTLAACGGSAEHVRTICGDVTEGTAALTPYDPARPVTALEYALGRFDLVEEAVSKARETSLPEAAAGTLRRAWLDPAVRSLAPWQDRIGALRTAVDTGSRVQVDAALMTALTLGTDGVDTGALRTAGYDACATAFTAPSLASVTSA